MAVDQPVSGTALSSTARVIFTVSDVNDNSPIFVSSTHTLSIFENAASPATIGVFTATDLDSGVNGEITYSNSATMPAQFTYDTTTGVLTQTATFDRENLPHTNPVTFQVKHFHNFLSTIVNSRTYIMLILAFNVISKRDSYRQYLAATS